MKELELQFTKMVKEQKATISTVCLMFSDDPDEVDELVQLTLINLWKGFADFNGKSSMRTWVWRVTMNTCISAERKNKRLRESTTSLERIGVDTTAEATNDKQIVALHNRIHRLGLFDRAIVLLWLEDMSYEEIGDIVGISAKNVGVKLARIREQLKKMRI